MKKILALALALLLLVGLAACGDGGSDGSGANAPAVNSGEEPQSGGEPGSDAPSQGGSSAEGAKLSGKLELIRLEGRDPSILRGVRILGTSVGSGDDINGKASSLTDVRCIFELNEWVEFYPDTDAEYALRVWVLKHRDDQAYYNDCKFSDLMPNFANYCDLHYPADADQPDEWPWGEFYLNPDDCEPGFYDFVFTYEGKAIAVLQTLFYNTGELSGKTGPELEALMHE